MDMSFDIQRLHVMMLAHIRDLQSHSAEGDLSQTDRAEEVISHCLENLIIIRPTNLLHLVTSLESLPEYMATHLPKSKLVLVVVDPLSGPSYWLDRYTAEKTKSDSGSRRVAPSPMRRAMWALNRIRVQYDVAIVYTCWTLGVSTQGPIYWQYFRLARSNHTGSTTAASSSTQRPGFVEDPMQMQLAPAMAGSSQDCSAINNPDVHQHEAELCHTVLSLRPAELLQPGFTLEELLMDRSASARRVVNATGMRYKPPLSLSRMGFESNIQIADTTLHPVPGF
jgi:hypothetical protein